jgi:hypothetical protein
LVRLRKFRVHEIHDLPTEKFRGEAASKSADEAKFANDVPYYHHDIYGGVGSVMRLKSVTLFITVQFLNFSPGRNSISLCAAR